MEVAIFASSGYGIEIVPFIQSVSKADAVGINSPNAIISSPFVSV